MPKTIVVTGASGHIGNALAGQLLAQGHTVRIIGRNADRLSGLIARGAQPWIGSLDDPKFMARATRGADSAFAMIPPNYGHPDQRGWGRSTADATAAGLQTSRVKTVVTLSSIGADLPDSVGGQLGGLYEMEQRYNNIPGLNLVHLRCGVFMENLLNSIHLVKNAGINGGMFGPDLPLPMVATRDVASRLAELLGRRTISGREVIELPGPRDYTHRQVTGVIGAAIGRPDLQYVQFSYEDGINTLRGFGFSDSAAVGLAEMAKGFNEERVKRGPRTPENTSPTTIEDFIRDVFLQAWNT